MKRRQFLGLSAAALAATASALPIIRRDIAATADTSAPRPLLMPPLLDTRATGRFSLTAQPGQSNFLGEAATPTAGFNQGYLGPTIVMRNGPLAATVTNALQETVTAHWHGMLVPGEHDGGPMSPVAPGQSAILDMAIAQRPATTWYHSHAHGATARHVYFGLAGAIHQTDGRDDARGLPSRYGVDDLTLILQDRRFDDAGRMVYGPDTTDILNGFLGERVLVNGQWNAVAPVPKGIVRLRLINGSNARIYTLHFNDRRPMHLVATDGGFLAEPYETTYLRLAPGERAEVLVDFAAGPAPVLMSARGLSLKILEFATDGTMTARITRLPVALDAESFTMPDIEMPTRRFALNIGGNSTGQVATGHAGHGAMIGAGAHGQLPGIAMNDFAINGRPFDMRRIDFEVALGSYERWIIAGGGAGVEHPFHVHGVHFRVISTGAGVVTPDMAGWKDTIVVSGQTELVARFSHPAGRDAPYMYHCHILEHEDAGMMGQFTVA